MTGNDNDGSESNESGGSEQERPERIGPYRILDILGEGGMAVVYLAAQTEPVKRQVALKILKPGMDTKQIVARFESERQALAVLDHPGIAKIFDGGVTESGRPYFVMERVHGMPITDYCDAHRLNTQERVGLFVEVCSAVQHAHHKGLIHRDLKPSNLLVGVVDGRPQVKVIDFGIAKAATPTMTERTQFTRVGQIIGTPQYMSPEQADTSGLDVDTRTDIYSLGVVLYEMLVGTVPLDLAQIGDQAMRLALRERDPAKPSTRITELGDTLEEVAKARRTDANTLKRQLQGDLDWVVMQAIEKDRTHRYETANALAVECQRFLKHEPVLARPPSAGYLLQRFVRRNRLVVMAGSVTIAAIVAGAVAATLGFLRATEAEKVAVQEAATAAATIEFLVDLFQVSDPWAFAPVRSDSGEITAREVLDMGAERIRTELQDQPEVQSGLMTAIGRVYLGLGLPDRAQPMIIEGLEVRRQTYPQRHIAIGDSLLALGMLRLIRGEYAEAVAAEREAISIYEDAWGEDVIGLALMLSDHAVTLSNNGNFDEALAVQLRALELLRKYPENREFEMGQALNNLGFVQNALSLESDAMVSFEEAIEVLAKTQARGLYSRALANLGAAYMGTGRLAESKQLQDEALAIKREWFGEDHTEVGYSVANLSFIYQRLGDYETAAALKKEAIEIFSYRLGENHPNIGIILIGLASNMASQGKYDEAETTYMDALARVQAAFGAESMREMIVRNGIGDLYGEQGRYAEAEASFQEALRIGTAVSPGHSNVAVARAGLARLSESSLTADEREQNFSAAIELLRQNEGPGSLRASLFQIDYAKYLAEQGKREQAKVRFEEGLESLSAAIPKDNPQYQEKAALYDELFGTERN